MTVLGHFSAAYIGYAAQQGVPAAGLLVPLSGVIATLGGLSVTFGYKAKLGAWLLVLFLVPVTLAMHNFWAVTDPMMRGVQMALFMKNVLVRRRADAADRRSVRAALTPAGERAYARGMRALTQEQRAIAGALRATEAGNLQAILEVLAR